MSQDPHVDIPRQPPAHYAYGDVIYWISIAASFLCALGPFLAIGWPANNVLDPQHLFYLIWQGKQPHEVWTQVCGECPGAHFWITNLLKGDGIIEFGIVLGCSSAGFAFLASAIAYLKPGKREPGWALLSLLAALAIGVAMLGIIQIAE